MRGYYLHKYYAKGLSTAIRYSVIKCIVLLSNCSYFYVYVFSTLCEQKMSKAFTYSFLAIFKVLNVLWQKATVNQIEEKG